MSVQEAAQYFNIGEKKLREFIKQHENEKFILWNGNRAQIKRELFEKYVNEKLTCI